ncbi:ROK family protein [Paenibacillus mucilaginosus]|nr:ROK family protein [Paenibacillus mucilaginosus]MCG7213304.1 ROK family protein [Paenibacillus mucilaginosus]
MRRILTASYTTYYNISNKRSHMNITNTAEIRSQNKKKIIEYLRNESSTKKIMSDRLELSFATVSNLCNQLIEEEILQITSSMSSKGGRIPGLISIRPNSKYTLCLDFNNAEDARVALVNLSNELVDCTKVVIQESADYSQYLQAYYDAALGLLEKHSISHSQLLGVGAAIPGIFYKKNNTVINSTNALFENKPMKLDIEQKFGLPAYLENESNLLALASLLRDQVKGSSADIVYIYLGEGLGVGITSRGSLLTGTRGLGGEISHMGIGARSFPCYCGKAGCIESELTISGFYRKLRGAEAALPDNPGEWWGHFVREVLSGEPAAVDVIAENGRLLGSLVSVLANIFDPDEVYIGGFIEGIFPVLHPYIVEEAQSRMATHEYFFPSIRGSAGYEHLLIQGCGELVFKQWNP